MNDKVNKDKKTLTQHFMGWSKWLFFVAAFILVIMTVLANMGGNNDMLKGALEQYLTEATGHYAQINTLNKVTFFPMIGFDFEDAVLHPINEQAIDQEVVIGRIGHAKMSMGFWEVMRGTGRVRDLELESVEAEAGVILPNRVRIDRLYIAETPDGDAQMVADGTIGTTTFTGSMDMEAHGTKFHPSYGFGPDREFKAVLGDLIFTGRLDNSRVQPVLNDLVFIHDRRDILHGDLALYKASSKHLSLKTSWLVSEHGSALNGDFEVGIDSAPYTFDGKVQAQPFSPDDFKDSGRLNKAVSYFTTVTGLTDLAFITSFLNRLAEAPQDDCVVWDMYVTGAQIESMNVDSCP